MIKALTLGVALALYANSPSALNQTEEDYMYSTLEDLCYASGDMARGDLVIKELEAIGVDYSIQEFKANAENRRNIIARIPAENAAHKLAFSAHYDRVGVGCGVIDNGSGTVVLLKMIKDIKANPRDDTDLTFLFFDAEEDGLVGSRYYVSNNPDTFEALFNIDMAAYGDSLMISSGVHHRGEFVPTTESLNKLIIELCNEHSIPYFWTENKWTDNVSFNIAGFPAASVVRVDSSFPNPYPIHNEADNMSLVQREALDATEDFMLDILDRY